LNRLLTALLLAALCLGTAHAGEPVTYLFPALLNQPAFAPWLIARQLGYYADAGYDVTFAVAQGGNDVAQQVAIGKVPIGGAIGDTPILVRNYGIRVKIIASIGGGSLTAIVAGADRGIHSLQDLRGKHLVVLSRTDSTYHVLLGALASAGIGPTDVAIDTGRPRDIVRRVLTGRDDACACVPDWEVDIRLTQPGAVVVPIDQAFPSMAQAIIASDRTIAEKPAMLRAVVSATLRGMQFVIDDPRKAAEVYVHAVPRDKGQLELVVRLLQAYVDQVYRGQTVIGQTDPARLDALQSLYEKEHFVRTIVPAKELYTNQFVAQETR
jgi:NitT/TauT family transport system substrate-binding protein